MNMQNNGGRPQKVKVTLTPESLNEILSKAYAESQDLRQKSIAMFNKNSRNMTDNSDIALIGKTNAEYLKIAAGATSTTLDIARIIKDYIQKDKAGDATPTENAKLNDNTKEEIYAIMNKMKQQRKKLPSGEDLADEFNKVDNEGIKSVVEGKTNNPDNKVQ